MKIVERIPAHYEVEEINDLGRSYKWRPEKVVVQCGGCGKRRTLERSQLITSIVTCRRCGARSTAGVREELLLETLSEDEVVHPWRYWHPREESGIPV